MPPPPSRSGGGRISGLPCHGHASRVRSPGRPLAHGGCPMATTARPGSPRRSKPAPQQTARAVVAVGASLVVFAACAYGPILRVPFIGDDYVFLDRTRDATIADLWSPRNTDFGWYRPWSREAHFFVLQHA